MEELKPSLIRQVEQTIDVLRRDEERLKAQLAEIEPKLEEARAMLQLIKTGSTPEQKPIVKKVSLLRQPDVLAMLDEMPEQFTTHEFADAVDSSKGAAANWLARFEKEGRLKRIVMGRGPQPSVWRKNV